MNQTAYWIAIVALIIAVFFLFRSVILWYFRIDERTELMKQQNQLLKEVRDEIKSMGKVKG